MTIPIVLRKPDPPKPSRLARRLGCDWSGVVGETLGNPWIWTVAIGIVLIATR